MNGSLCLNGTWQLTYAEGQPLVPPDQYTAPTLRGRGLLPARVPAPIHHVLQEAGLIADPNVALNSLAARWVEEQFWIYRHTFVATEAAAAAPSVSLAFARLEFDTIVWLNGEEIGRHANANRPARFDVTGRLKPGENLLVVQTSSGMHAAASAPVADYSTHHMDQLTGRPWLRKPQYQCGWDWNARLVNVGILGDVTLEWHSTPRLAQAAVYALPSDDLASATVRVRAIVDGIADAPADVTLRARVVETGATTSQSLRVSRGENRCDLALEIERPRLWWPIGHGPQDLYTVEVALEAGGQTQSITRRTGVRRVEVDQSPHPEQGRYFTLKINNRPIFCKGGNWVPADMLYSAVTPERYRELVDLAVAANFNILRVWGGGVFADHALCDACDEAGVLLWHDFLFACAKYPGDFPEFVDEVRSEVTHAVRDLAHHPSLVVWCGNNEIEWGDWEWGYDRLHRTHPHYALFHRDMPKICREEDPSTFYWISSPYSPDFGPPNDPTIGDQHPWGVSILNPGGADFWLYRGYVDRFPNEGGVIGVSSPATLRQFLPENERRLLSPVWQHHDNPFACAAPKPGDIGRAYATVELWTGRDPLAMDWEEYAFASALLQAEGLGEYITNYRRRMFSSASAIFWMYNDSWPVTHGWTIVDYYRRKKLCYHPVRRAFSPVTVVVAIDGDDVAVYGVNDTPHEWAGRVRYGLFTLAGERPLDESKGARLAANASTLLARFPRKKLDSLGVRKAGAFAVLSREDRVVAQHRLFLARFKELEFAPPRVEMKRQGDTLTLQSSTFAWGVCLDVDGEKPLADNCFDLLPGVPYAVPWPASLGEPQVVRIGNRDAIRT